MTFLAWVASCGKSSYCINLSRDLSYATFCFCLYPPPHVFCHVDSVFFSSCLLVTGILLNRVLLGWPALCSFLEGNNYFWRYILWYILPSGSLHYKLSIWFHDTRLAPLNQFDFALVLRSTYFSTWFVWMAYDFCTPLSTGFVHIVLFKTKILYCSIFIGQYLTT